VELPILKLIRRILQLIQIVQFPSLHSLKPHLVHQDYPSPVAAHHQTLVLPAEKSLFKLIKRELPAEILQS